MRRIFLGMLLLSAVLLSGCAGNTAGKTAEDDPAPAVTDEAVPEPESPGVQIDFEGTDLEGNSVASSVLAQSKLTMINVWATYCNPCLREMPDLGELAAEYAPEDFQLIGIVSDVMEGDDQTLAENLVQQTGADYTHLLLNESVYYALLTDVANVPTTFFLDEEGNVLDRVIGAKEKSAWKEMIDALLEEQ